MYVLSGASTLAESVSWWERLADTIDPHLCVCVFFSRFANRARASGVVAEAVVFCLDVGVSLGLFSFSLCDSSFVAPNQDKFTSVQIGPRFLGRPR